MNQRYEEELGDAADVVGALGNLAADQAAETPDRPGTVPDGTAPDRADGSHGTGSIDEPTPPTETPPNAAPPAELGRKTVVISYRTSTGNPPTLRYGVRIRYESRDAEDPKVQQGQLDASGQCELEVPEDVETIRVFTTPFGGFEGDAFAKIHRFHPNFHHN